MDILHTPTLRQLERIPYEALGRLIEKKLSERGMQVSPEQRQRIVDHFVAGGSLDAVPFEMSDAARNRIERLTITEDEGAGVMRTAEAVRAGLPALLHSVTNETATHMLPTFKRNWPAEARRQRAEMEPFTQRLARRWRRPISRLAMLLTIARQLGESINDEVRRPEFADRRHTVEVLTRLHARACQISSEILVLLSGGFADGAMARWRTLHEIAVTTFFVARHGEPVAERYIAYRHVESYRAAIEYETHRERLGYEPLTAEELRRRTEAFATVESRYGKDFKKPYGWAADALGKTDPKFVHIEEAAGIDHLRPFYKLATQNVHANPNGAFFRLGLVSETDMLLAGASNLGLGEPGQNTALSLTQITTTLGNLSPTIDNIVTIRVLTLLLPEVQEAFARVDVSVRKQATASRSAK